MSEADVLRAVQDYLQAKRIFSLRMNVGAVRMEGGRFMRFGVPGQADVLAFPWRWCMLHGEGGEVHKTKAIVPTWIECKTAKGRQSELQKSFEDMVLAEGHRYFVVRDIEGLELALDSIR